MNLRKIGAWILSVAVAFSAVPLPGFAAGGQLQDVDNNPNEVSKFSSIGDLVGVKAKVSSENVDYGEKGTDPENPSNGPIIVCVENNGYADVEISYNGRSIARSGNAFKTELHVNKADNIVLKSIAKKKYEDYSGWKVNYNWLWYTTDEDTIVVDLSSENLEGVPKVSFSPWSGKGGTGYTSGGQYSLVDNDYGAFGINSLTGEVFVKDPSRLRDTFLNLDTGGIAGKSENTYTMTEEKIYKSAYVSSKEKISIQDDFEVSFQAYFGDRNRNGADGMTFYLSRDKQLQKGATSSYLGYSYAGINRSVAIEFDTHRNPILPSNDPNFRKHNNNHISINKGGSVNYNNSVSFLTKTNQLTNAYNILLEDGKYHDIKVKWSSAKKELSFYFDNQLIGVLKKDIAEYMGSGFDSEQGVYFGFTASTGGESNNQKIKNITLTKLPGVRVKAMRKDGFLHKFFPIDITNDHEPLEAVDDVESVFKNETNALYVCDRNGRIFKVDLKKKTYEKFAITDVYYLDIANDKNGTLYGLSGNKLYKSIDERKEFVANFGASYSQINALTVDSAGNFYYIKDQKLYFYNVETKNITKIMDVKYPSLGDLVFHGEKLYYAGYKGARFGTNPVLFELDIETESVKDVKSIPRNTYGLSSANGKLLLLVGKELQEMDVNTGKRTKVMTINLAHVLVGAAQGDVIVQGNVLSNDKGESDKMVSKVDGQSLNNGSSYKKIYGKYGTLRIKPDGSYVYTLNGRSLAVQNLSKGETLTEEFPYDAKYKYGEGTSSAVLRINIKGTEDAASFLEGKRVLHLDAFDLNGDKKIDANPTDGTPVKTWNDSAGVNNKATSTGGSPKLVLDGINENRAISFADYTGSMDIESDKEINESEFYKKTIATVIKTGKKVDGVQYIYEQGGTERGYNLAIAPDENGKPSLYAMVYNKKEWSDNPYHSIKLTEVKPDTVYKTYMVHNAITGAFSGYVDGDNSEVDKLPAQTGVSHQFSHSNPVGIGGVNSQTVSPHGAHDETTAKKPFSGLIGEIISWNDALTFEEVQELNKKLSDKWNQPQAVSDITTKQEGDKLSVVWAPVEGADKYEVYLSEDGTIDGNDIKIDTTNNKAEFSLEKYRDKENMNIIVRYTKDKKYSEQAVKNFGVLKKPQGFVYAEEKNKVLFGFKPEKGKAYVIRYGNGQEKPIGVTSNRVEFEKPINFDPKTVELYEVAVSGEQGNYTLGHSLKADGPKGVDRKKVEGLKGKLENDKMVLDWSEYKGINGEKATEYIVYGGNDPDKLVEVGRTTNPAYTYTPVESDKVPYKYFKVQAVTEDDVFEKSQPSDTVSVMTPYYKKIKEAQKLHDEAKEGLGDDELVENDLYDPDEYELGSKKKLQDAIDVAKKALEGEGNIQDVLSKLEEKVEWFKGRKVTTNNAIVLKFVKTDGSNIKDLETYYGPLPDGSNIYRKTVDVSITGYSLVSGGDSSGENKITLEFGKAKQEKILKYSEDLSDTIKEIDKFLEGPFKLGPNPDGFYSVDQYDKAAHDNLKKAVEAAKKKLKEENLTTEQKLEIANDLLSKKKMFIDTHVTENNKVTAYFKDKDGKSITIVIDKNPTASVVKYAPNGKEISFTPPSDNYYRPEPKTVKLIFGKTPKEQNITYIMTDLNKLVKEAEKLHENAEEGPDEKGYKKGQYEEGAKKELKKAIDAANEVLKNPVSTKEQKDKAKKDLEDALKKFKDKEITDKNAITIEMISGETGEKLGTKTYYGPKNYKKTISLEDTVPGYVPYVNPKNKREENSEDDKLNKDAAIVKEMEVTFGDGKQTIHVMYREDDKGDGVDKSDWPEKALDSIKTYDEKNKIPWKANSHYDIKNQSTADARENNDFLNILRKALKPEDDYLADENFVDKYIEAILDEDDPPINDYDELVDMLKKHFKFVSGNYYSEGPNGSISENPVGDSKAIHYEEQIRTMALFTMKADNVSNPSFKFELQGNAYLNFSYPKIELYKFESMSALKGTKNIESGTLVHSDVSINTDTTNHLYKVKVEPVDSTSKTGEVYVARIQSRIGVNTRATYGDGKLTVQDVLDMYKKNVTEDNKLKDSRGNTKQTIESFELQYAIDSIPKPNEKGKIVDGLYVASYANWGEGTEKSGQEPQMSKLKFEMKSMQRLPGSF